MFQHSFVHSNALEVSVSRKENIVGTKKGNQSSGLAQVLAVIRARAVLALKTRYKRLSKHMPTYHNLSHLLVLLLSSND